MSDEYVDDDGTLSCDIVFAEQVPEDMPILAQALWIGVRPGYGEDGKRLPEPTIWVQYQQRHMASSLTGCVAISPESWDKINEAVQWRVAEWRRINAPDNIHPAGARSALDRDSADADETAHYQPELPFPSDS
jgi:hypothetical protein